MGDLRGPIEIADVPDELAGLFKGLVSDVTNPVYREHLRGILQGEVQMLAAQAAGAPAELVERGRAHTRAALAALANVPGMVIASKRGEFEALATRAFNALFAVGGLALDRLMERYLGPAVTPRGAYLDPARAAEMLGAPRVPPPGVFVPVAGVIGEGLALTPEAEAALAESGAAGEAGAAGGAT